MSEKKRYIRMSWPGSGVSSCIVEPQDVDDVADDSPCVLTEVWMTPEEYDALPEFES